MAKKPNKGMKLLALAGGVALMIVAWRFPVPLVVMPGATNLISLIAVSLGILLGWRDACLIVTLYVLGLVLGLPPLVWHEAQSSESFLDVKTNGLTIGLIAAAYIAARIAPKGLNNGISRVAIAALCGHLAYMLVGIGWLSRFVPPLDAAHTIVQSQSFPILAKSILAVGVVAVLGRFVKR